MKYFRCSVVVGVTDDHWDSSCDQTFAVGAGLRNRVLEGFESFEEISEAEFKDAKRIFTEEGGI